MPEPDTQKKANWEKLWDMMFGRKVLEQLANPPKQAPPPMQNYDYVKGQVDRWQAEEARKREEAKKSKQPGAQR